MAGEASQLLQQLGLLGRELFLEYRCINCHKSPQQQAIAEVGLDAPSFEGIGARRNPDWMARWILDPKATRGSVHMPKLLELVDLAREQPMVLVVDDDREVCANLWEILRERGYRVDQPV